jgi:hypothetical protein
LSSGQLAPVFDAIPEKRTLPPELTQTRRAFESGIRNQHFEPGDITSGRSTNLGDSV